MEVVLFLLFMAVLDRALERFYFRRIRIRAQRAKSARLQSSMDLRPSVLNRA